MLERKPGNNQLTLDKNIDLSPTSSDDDADYMDFKEFKESLNDQFSKKNNRFEVMLLQSNAGALESAAENKKNTSNKIFASTPLKTLERDDDAEKQKKIKNEFAAAEEKILHIYELSEKIEKLKADSEQYYREEERENRQWRKKWGLEKTNDSPDEHKKAYDELMFNRDKTRTQEFVDYILLEMAGVNKTNDYYQDLKNIDYQTLVRHMQEHLSLHVVHHLHKYKTREEVQYSFITHLYHHVLGKHMHHVEAITETPPEAPLEEKHTTAPHEAQTLSMLDSIITILQRVYRYLLSCFSCDNTNIVEQPYTLLDQREPRSGREDKQLEEKSETPRYTIARRN